MLGWQVIKYPTLRQLCISKCLCRMIHLSTSRQTDVYPQPSKLWFSFVWNSDRLAFRFPSPVSGSSWLVSKGVCGRFFSFSISKPQSPWPRKHTPELCPLHLRPTDTQAFMHACKHTHTGTPWQLQACIYVYPQRHAHLLLMLKSLLILSLCTFIRTTSSLICSTMQTLKTHGKLQTNKTVQKPAKDLLNVNQKYSL